MSARRAAVWDARVAGVVMGVATPLARVAPFLTEPPGVVSTSRTKAALVVKTARTRSLKLGDEPPTG